ncbi:miniconductance mechanosensitive channel MscM [Candidatus Erwinia haradaeae]|uniref:Miniconductance mechanosensitive channel MscM n=1 Tax=Candidatus Erwinia haradaeae TaxID=1922217 RepID=A0A451DAA9_9GAMM|nr:Miniconductance mechanosensitive channel MscM [Candidatus Erwinia haradaeae]
MFYLLFFTCVGWIALQPVHFSNAQNTLNLQQEHEEVKLKINSIIKDKWSHDIHSISLQSIEEYEKAMDLVREYLRVINDFRKQSHESHPQIFTKNPSCKPACSNMGFSDFKQENVQFNNQIIADSWKAQSEYNCIQKMSHSLSALLQSQYRFCIFLHQVNHQLLAPAPLSTINKTSYLIQQKKELNILKSRVDELKIEKFLAEHRKELLYTYAKIYQQQDFSLKSIPPVLRNEPYSHKRNEVDLSLGANKQLEANIEGMPRIVIEQWQLNCQLSEELKKQALRRERVVTQQRTAAEQTIQIRQALSTICEQSQWLGASNVLGEALRGLVARLPKILKPQQLDREMAELRAKRLYYSDLFERKNSFKQHRDAALTTEQENFLLLQFQIEHELLVSLLSGSDVLTLELTKLNVANSQLVEAFNEVKDATHRYLFWTPDVNAMNFNYPRAWLNDLRILFSSDVLGQLGKALVMMFTSQTTLLPLFLSGLLVFCSLSSRRHFHDFLKRASGKVGKVTKDNFNLTIRTLFWSILASLPLPMLLEALGYGLQNSWPYSIAVAIGEGVVASVPLLWGLMICKIFACENGLFTVHFRWPKHQVVLAMRCYTLCLWIMVPLIIMSISFENFLDYRFSSTLGRMCFMLICGLLSMMAGTLKRAGIPLYLNHRGNVAHVMNNIVWNMIIVTPVVAILATCIGYLDTAQALLARLGISLAIGFVLLVVYCIIRRWMLIQRRRIAFDRARIRRAEILSQRARIDDGLSTQRGMVDHIESEERNMSLDSISTQSLRLVRSLLTLIALVFIIALWSEIHAAFSFLENIHLWDVSSMMHGVDTVQPITLGSVMHAILVFLITTQLVRNMPALLELVLLQHINLMPGTGYAITTSSKYLIVLLGSLTGFSLIGIDWSKLQWLVAGLSLGLGFGLQEIFANFISGLIILFEKPIRIGDTVTIRNLTGSVTRINTRATTITDWDRKEIIVPNRSFITEQFTNWSLSDSVTRVVLSIPASLSANTEEVVKVLLDAAGSCRFVLKNPTPEAFLVDLQQGLQSFELRVHAAEMEHRMPLRHDLHRLILLGFQENNIDVQSPALQVRMEVLQSQSDFK